MNRKNMKAYIQDLESRLAKHGEIPLRKNSWYKTRHNSVLLYITYFGKIFAFGLRACSELSTKTPQESGYYVIGKINNHSFVEDFLKNNILKHLGFEQGVVIQPLDFPVKANLDKSSPIICKRDGIYWGNAQIFDFQSKQFAEVVRPSKPVIGDFLLTKNPFSVLQVDEEVVSNWERVLKDLDDEGIIWKFLDRHKNVKVIADLLTLKGDFDNV